MNDSLSFIKPYLRGWPIILASMVLAYMAASKYLNYVTPMYESTAKLRMADMNEGVPNSNLFKDLDVFANTQKINAEIELLKSHTLISKALAKVPFEVQIFRSGSIRKTELFNDSPVLITPLDWPEDMKDKTFQLEIKENLEFVITTYDGIKHSGSLGDTINLQNAVAVLQLNEELLSKKKNLQIADRYTFSVVSLSKRISQINSGIDIIAVDKDVPVIRISYKSSHPEKAALFPDALAEAYIEDYIDNKYGAANVTVDFLNDRITEMNQKLSESEQMILNYRDRKSITNIQQETETDLRKISQLKIQQTNLKMSLEAIKDLEDYVQNGKDKFLDLAPNFEAFTDLLSTEIIKNIKQLQAEKKDLLLQYTEKDDRVIVIDAKIRDLTSYLIESISNTRKNLQTKYDKLTADILESEKIFIEVPEKERMMTILNREFEIYQQSYNFLNQKKIEAEIAKAAKIAFHRVITPATKSLEPVSPNRVIIKVVSALLGMIAALVLIFIVHSLKARVNDLSTVESQSNIPVIAAVPRLKKLQDSEAFFIKALAEWEVKGLIKPEGLTCLSGFNHKHGATFITDQLASVLSLQNRKLLLIKIQREVEGLAESFWKLIHQDTATDVLLVSESKLKIICSKQWQSFLQEKSQGYAQTLVLNTTFGQSHTLATMAVSELNVVCLDTRLTPARLITEVDLLKDEFNLSNVFFAINRTGYTPSFFREILQYTQKAIDFIKTLIRK
jgi:uncharacterized protein involved in exopolysaccharide biosynthesis